MSLAVDEWSASRSDRLCAAVQTRSGSVSGQVSYVAGGPRT